MKRGKVADLEGIAMEILKCYGVRIWIDCLEYLMDVWI